MDLVVFGDSFAHGLNKTPYRFSDRESNRQSFPQQIVDQSDVFSACVNKGLPGHSNGCIAHDVYQYVIEKNTSDCFFLVCWTTFMRRHHWDGNTYVPCRKDPPHFTDHGRIYETLRDIAFVTNLLQHNNIPYLMTQAFDDLKKYTHDKTIMIPNWIEYPAPNNTLFDICAKRWLSDVEHNDYKKNHAAFDVVTKYLAGCKHPNKLGHQKIAETLLPYILQKILKNKHHICY